MKSYEVTMEITGYVRVFVQASSEADAIREAVEAVYADHIEEWRAHSDTAQVSEVEADEIAS